MAQRAYATGEGRADMTKTTEANTRMERGLREVDPAIAGLLREEAQRQATGLELIPSENLVSEAVLEAMGSVFTNKLIDHGSLALVGSCFTVSSFDSPLQTKDSMTKIGLVNEIETGSALT